MVNYYYYYYYLLDDWMIIITSTNMNMNFTHDQTNHKYSSLENINFLRCHP